MSKKGERQLDLREVLAFALVFLLILPICIILTTEGLKYAHAREKEHLTLRRNIVEDLASNEGWVLASAEEWYDRNLSASVKLMVDSLNTFVSTEGYTGPSVLDDGFILSFQGDKAVIPDGLDVVETTITRALAIICTMVLNFATMLVYLYAIRRCVRGEVLTRSQARRYSPRRLRVRMLSAILAGALAVFAVSITLQGVGQLYVEMKYGQDTLGHRRPADGSDGLFHGG